MLYVFYITTTPYLPCNKNKGTVYMTFINITLTTGYKNLYDMIAAHINSIS